MLEAIYLPATCKQKPVGVLWLHGLGASGDDFASLVPWLQCAQPDRFQFLFPHAPARAVTLNGGAIGPAWYDLTHCDPSNRDDFAGIEASCRQLDQLLAHYQFDPASTVVAGFSQGGALALHYARQCDQLVRGVVALSCYLPGLAGDAPPAKHTPPILQCHGQFDQVVQEDWARASYEALQAEHQIQWASYPMGHEVCPEQLQMIGTWLSRQLL